ncbi:MAG: hypothetical protein AABY10_02985 [Nanoarchaeota archaeon]
MQSKTGSILLLISGILNLIGTLFFLIFFFFFFAVTDGSQTAIFIALFIIFLVFYLASGLLKLYSARLMKSSKRTKNGGILGLVLGILTFDVLAIIGGILGIIDSGK